MKNFMHAGVRAQFGGAVTISIGMVVWDSLSEIFRIASHSTCLAAIAVQRQMYVSRSAQTWRTVLKKLDGNAVLVASTPTSKLSNK